MNFYKHHIGDYAQATAHLSFVEDAAYARLIRKYYAEEKPFPADIKAIQRLTGARTKEEKQAIADVIGEFFVLQDDGWHNKRCDMELTKANAQAETNRQIAVEREARRKARKASNESETNGSRNEHESCNESFASREPSQTPDSRHQTPDSRLQTIKTTTTTTTPPLAQAREGASPISAPWEPTADFWILAKRSSLTSDTPVYADALTNFIAYWLTNPGESRTQSQWESAFLASWKRDLAHRLQSDKPPKTRPGQLSPHNDFEKRDYSVGINPDGSF